MFLRTRACVSAYARLCFCVRVPFFVSSKDGSCKLYISSKKTTAAKSRQSPETHTPNMAIENEDACFALLCAKLRIANIVLLVTLSDEEIRRRCNHAQLAQLVIELKHDTLAELTNTETPAQDVFIQ